MCSQKSWNVETAKHHYLIDSWGNGYFDISENGNIVAKTTEMEVDLYALSKELRAQGVSLPVLVRFPQILQQCLDDLCSAFDRAIESSKYTSTYTAAYPIKVNQQASVIKHFQTQRKWPIAFEVGSKAELMACLGMFDEKTTIICNGYKDESYIRLALIGRQLGHDVVIVLESLGEFNFLLKHSKELGVHTSLGMRVRLSSIAKGNWQNTGGDYSKFGLTADEVLTLVQGLKENNLLMHMKMMHFHMGSQISDIKDIRVGLQEGMHFFSQLHLQGIQFEMLNVGGGLAVDYEGGGSDRYFSMNYSVADYAETVIDVVKTCCEQHSLQMPKIVSENGRAMTAYHAVLLTNVIDAEYRNVKQQEIEDIFLKQDCLDEDLKGLIDQAKLIDKTVINSKGKIKLCKQFSNFNIALKVIHDAFANKQLGIIEKATAEKLTYYIYRAIVNSDNDLSQDELNKIEGILVAKYFCNFSLFQSTPDIWGLKQILPIMPLHYLTMQPNTHARIVDLTCDSDGRIDQYVEAGGVRPHISLHEYHSKQDYLLGVFLIGAYQEVLGDMHNLFGNTNSANIVIHADGTYRICDEEPGDTIKEILSYLHIDTGSMQQRWLERLNQNNVVGDMQNLVMQELEKSLQGNSYLSS